MTIADIVRLFDETYQLHAGGATQTQILIVNDIVAAASDDSKEAKNVNRNTILFAIRAVDNKVPLPVARKILKSNLSRALADEKA